MGLGRSKGRVGVEAWNGRRRDAPAVSGAPPEGLERAVGVAAEPGGGPEDLEGPDAEDNQEQLPALELTEDSQSIRKMQAAIHAFQQFPAGQNTSAPARRDDLLAEAAEQVWYFLIHREALRLPYYSEIFADYDIPLEIQKRIGPRNLPAPAQNPAKR